MLSPQALVRSRKWMFFHGGTRHFSCNYGDGNIKDLFCWVRNAGRHQYWYTQMRDGRMERFRYGGKRLCLIHMPKRRRDRHDIVIDILKKAKSGKTKTELMRDVNISFSQAQEYMGMLQKNGLLEKTIIRRLITTEKGLKFLENCKDCFLFTWDRLS